VFGFLGLPIKPMKMKKWLLLLLVLYAVTTYATDVRNVTFQVDILNQHYWRGFVFGNAPAIEPQVTLGMKNFSFNFWAAQTLDNSYSEIDLIPSYSAGNFRFSLLDYYNPLPGESNRYFNFSKIDARHSGEAVVSYSGSAQLPLHILVGTFLYGDRHPVNHRHQFSTYVQASYSFFISGNAAELSAAITPWESYYSDRFDFLHAGFSVSRQIIMENGTRLPLKFSLNVNPSASRAWIIFNIGLVTVRDINKQKKIEQ
jgi:hypothetical protein